MIRAPASWTSTASDGVFLLRRHRGPSARVWAWARSASISGSPVAGAAGSRGQPAAVPGSTVVTAARGSVPSTGGLVGGGRGHLVVGARCSVGVLQFGGVGDERGRVGAGDLDLLTTAARLTDYAGTLPPPGRRAPHAAPASPRPRRRAVLATAMSAAALPNGGAEGPAERCCDPRTAERSLVWCRGF